MAVMLPMHLSHRRGGGAIELFLVPRKELKVRFRRSRISSAHRNPGDPDSSVLSEQ